MGRNPTFSKLFLDSLNLKIIEVVEKDFSREYLQKYYIKKFNAKSLLDTGKEKISVNSENNLVGFAAPIDFVNWWMKAWVSQNGTCIYCECRFSDIDKLIENKKLNTRLGKGGSVRGPFPEIERLNGFAGDNVYSEANCALVCYYCNNDKSNVYDNETYKMFLAPAKKKLVDYLLSKID